MKNISEINTIEELDAYRQKVNESCDERKKFLILTDKANKLSQKPFTYLKESCENMASSLFETKNGRTILKKYTKLIKEDKCLNKMHNLCETIRKSNKDCDVDFLISHITSENWNINKKNLKESTSKLGAILAEAYMELGEKSDLLLATENSKYSAAVQYIAENTKNSKNIVEYSNAIKIIRDRIMENTSCVNLYNECGNLDTLTNDMIDEFNTKYSGKLSDEEKLAIKEIAESEDSEKVFNKYKNSCINKIKEAKEKSETEGDKESAKRLSNIHEQISKKEYSVDTVTNDICNLIELSNIF